MADSGPSTSQVRPQADQQQQPNQQQQQQQQQQQEAASRNGRKRRLSMNRKKDNKKGALKVTEHVEKPNPLLEFLLFSLRTCPAGTELKALVNALQPTMANIEMVLNTVKEDLRKVLEFPGNQAFIYEFGSIKSGLLLKDSDLDFYVHFANEKNERDEQIKLIHVVCSRMERGTTFQKITKILGAKVPLLRAINVRTNLQCDINFSNARGCYNSKFIYAVMQFDERIHQLSLIVKFWAQCAHVFTFHKQMNSYCLVMMIIFYLQTRKLPVIPSVEDMQQGIARINFGPWNLGYPTQIQYKTWNVNSVRELLVGFFKYYSEFDFSRNLISPFVGRLCTLEELEKKTIRELATYYRAVEREDYPEFIPGPCFSIQDPFELNMNVGKVLRTKELYEQILLSFRHAYALCLRYQEKPFAELLVALYTDKKRYEKPKARGKRQILASAAAAAAADAAAKKRDANGTTVSPAKAGTTSANPPSNVLSSTDCWYSCRLPAMENELFLVKEILLARDPDRKRIVTTEHIRQLWCECMLDFIVDILRKLYMVKMEPVDETSDGERDEHRRLVDQVRRFEMTCERQVLIARKRINITNEEELRREIEISKARWEKNHPLRFRTRIELTSVDGDVEMRVPKNQPKNGPLRLFIDTCFLVHIRRCVRGYFMVMLAKAKEKALERQCNGQQQQQQQDTSVPQETEQQQQQATSVPVETEQQQDTLVPEETEQQQQQQQDTVKKEEDEEMTEEANEESKSNVEPSDQGKAAEGPDASESAAESEPASVVLTETTTTTSNSLNES